MQTLPGKPWFKNLQSSATLKSSTSICFARQRLSCGAAFQRSQTVPRHNRPALRVLTSRAGNVHPPHSTLHIQSNQADYKHTEGQKSNPSYGRLQKPTLARRALHGRPLMSCPDKEAADPFTSNLWRYEQLIQIQKTPPPPCTQCLCSAKDCKHACAHPTGNEGVFTCFTTVTVPGAMATTEATAAAPWGSEPSSMICCRMFTAVGSRRPPDRTESRRGPLGAPRQLQGGTNWLAPFHSGSFPVLPFPALRVTTTAATTRIIFQCLLRQAQLLSFHRPKSTLVDVKYH